MRSIAIAWHNGSETCRNGGRGHKRALGYGRFPDGQVRSLRMLVHFLQSGVSGKKRECYAIGFSISRLSSHLRVALP